MAINIENADMYFIHIPKTAGSSVTLWLQENFITSRLAKKHSPPNEINPELVDGKKSFTIIRNPYERIHSWYYFKILRAQRFYQKAKHNSADERWAKIGRTTTFDSWVQDYFANKDQKEIMILKQVDYIDKNTKHILRQENLKEDFKKIQIDLKCFANLPIHNVTLNRSNYRNDYTATSKKIIEQYYKQDLEHFNYEF